MGAFTHPSIHKQCACSMHILCVFCCIYWLHLLASALGRSASLNGPAPCNL